MNNKIFFTFIFILVSSISGHCQANISFVDPLNTIDENKFAFELVKMFDVNIKNVGQTNISFFTINKWTDPGDVLKIHISNSKYDTSYTNIDGWVKFDNNYTVPIDLKKLNELDTDLALLHTGKGYAYLILFGWVYANDPGLCTIVDLQTGELLLNKNLWLMNFNGNKAIVNDTIYCTFKKNMR